MSDNTTTEITEHEASAATDTPSPKKRWTRWLIIVGAALLLLLTIFGFALNSTGGKSWLAERISNTTAQSGLQIKIGRIEGSIYGQSTLHDVQLFDPKGRFAEINQISLDWTPFAWIFNELNIKSIIAPEAHLARLPELLKRDDDSAILPGFDIFVGEARIDKLVIGQAVTGHEHVARLNGSIDVRAGRAMLLLDAVTSNSDDKIELSLNAEPERDQFDLMTKIRAPKNGVLAAMVGLNADSSVDLEGSGSWTKWSGDLLVGIAEQQSANLILTAENGVYGARGDVFAVLFPTGLLRRMVAPSAAINLSSTLVDRVADLDGDIESAAMTLRLKGGVDFGNNAFSGLQLDATMLRPSILLKQMRADNLIGHAVLNGRFNEAEYDYRLNARSVDFGLFGLDQAEASGVGAIKNGIAHIPVKLKANRVTGLGANSRSLFTNLVGSADMRLNGYELSAIGADIRTSAVATKNDIQINLSSGKYRVETDARLPKYQMAGFGAADVAAKLTLASDARLRATLGGSANAVMTRLDNAFLRQLGGGLPKLKTSLALGPNSSLIFRDLRLDAPLITANGGGSRRSDGSVALNGLIQHKQYGPAQISLNGQISKPQIALLFDRPFDAAGLRKVRLELEPNDGGFQFVTNGGSSLGAFAGQGMILLPAGGDAAIDVSQLKVSNTVASGRIRPVAGGLSGNLKLAGGGVSGFVKLQPVNGKQQVLAELKAKNARFDGPEPIFIRTGTLDVTALLADGSSTLDATLAGQGIGSGNFMIGRIAANAKLEDGTGNATASIAGTRGSKFDFQTKVRINPNEYRVTGEGKFQRWPLRLTEAVILDRQDGWRLQPAKLSVGRGHLRLGGQWGTARTDLDADVSRLPLAILDLAYPDAGLSGTASGKIEYQKDAATAATGKANLKLNRLSRSGLVLNSRPVDVGLNAVLSRTALAARGLINSEGKTSGRFQAKISPLQASGNLVERLSKAPIFAQVRYNGRADTLWRLTGVELIDLTGPVAVAADMRGSLNNPAIKGSLKTSGARLESPLAGTVVSNISAKGSFSGSQLMVTNISGTTKGGGQVSGSGRFDLAADNNGIGIDVNIQAEHALLINRDDFSARVSGPINLKSRGRSGLISGNVVVNQSHFKLGRANAAATLPKLKVREINRRADERAPRAASRPWRLALDANIPNKLRVEGLGLASEWGASLKLSGVIDNPRLRGRANMIRGDYDFAGRRFALSRGTIRFVGSSPPDPILDIEAEAGLSGLNATINVRGSGQRPEIAFSSIPALPQEELLSRLLFGTSIQKLSAPEALQLASAVASLQSGGGLDPINAVRKAAGLDRLRILPADVTTGQGTSLAAGKYITRRAYVEVVTDGKGYSATQIEFQITRWLSLLSSISTIGRQSANIRVSKDY